MFKNVKAVSTLWLILSILISLIVGGLISYVWVMSSYYNMPENTTLLIVTDVFFSAANARCFNVTVLNPSNSVSDVNITAIRLSVEGKNEAYNVTVATPSLPFLLRRGTKVTFNCSKNWGSFAGEAVRIEPVAANATTKSCLYTTPKVKWDIKPNFDASKTTEYFNLTVENFEESVINLTISEIKWFGLSINENITPSLPYVLLPNHRETFRCYKNWANVLGENVTITVRTAEGYELKSTNRLLGAFLYVKEVKFDYTDTTYFNVTINSSEDSAVTAVVNEINLTLQNGESFAINETREHVSFKDLLPAFRSVPPNGSVTFACLWNWTCYRNENFTINVYTEQGFKVPPTEQLRTPPEVVWNISDVKFDLDNTESFSVNVTNMPCSLYGINVTEIDFNSHKTTVTSSIVSIGNQSTFTCEYNWTSSVGKDATITVHVLYKGNESSSISYNLTLPYFKITEASFSNFSPGNPYVNITVYTSEFSTVNATVTELFIEAENGTCLFNATITDGYELPKGMNMSIVYSWDWTRYSGQEITVRVRAADGSEVTKNVTVP